MMTEARTIDMRRAALRSMPQGGGPAQEAVSSPAKPLPILAEQPAGLIFFPFIAAALWGLTHSYPGILGDAAIYVGRALADLDPNGVGRDMMFTHDRQSHFSIFPFLLDHLVASLGTARTDLFLALLSMAVWMAAVAGFASRYVPKPFIALVVIFVAVLPTSYGAPQRFGFSEVLAEPRPFAEALVLAALAGLAGGRTWLGFFCLFIASLVHPLMALAGWGVFAIVLGREDWRWVALFVGATLVALAAAVAGVPLLHRLFVVMAPDLKAFAESRSPHLFPTLWSIEFLGPVLAQMASLVIAASLVDGRRRLILLAVIPVGLGGIALQAFFGDHLSLLLVIQAQLWRTAWLMAALGAVALAFCALELRRDGPRGHVVLALLALAWLASETPGGAGLLVSLALAVHFTARRIDLPLTWMTASILWGIACLLALVFNVHYLIGYSDFMARIPPDAPHAVSYFWVRRYIDFPLLGLLLLLAFARRPSRMAGAALAIMALLLATAAVWFWDARGGFQKMVDSARHLPELTRILSGRPGEILWVDGLGEAWYLAGRPQWASEQQGVSSVFSAELARKWHARMEFLVRERLVEKNALSPFRTPTSAELPRLTKENVAHLCARPDAPAWIVAPVYKDTIIPPGLAAHEWRLPQPNFRMTEEPDFYAWHRIDAYAILPCAGGPTQQR